MDTVNQATSECFNALTQLRELDGPIGSPDMIHNRLIGFQGKFAMRGGEIELLRIIDSLRPEIDRHIEVPDSLSPAGEAPDEPLVRSSQRNPFLWVALGVFAVAIAVFISLRISIDHQVTQIQDRVEQLDK